MMFFGREEATGWTYGIFAVPISDDMLNGQPGTTFSLSFRGLELGGETGELLNELKKLERIRLGLAGGKCDLQAIEEELADVMICVDLIAMDLDIELGPAIQKKFNKTSEKFGLSTRFDSAQSPEEN